MFGRKRPVEVSRDSHSGPSFPINDPGLVQYLGGAGWNEAGVSVDETSALGLTAVWRAVSLIAGTIAGLPLKSYRTDADDARSQVPSFLDNPGAPYFTPFVWKELVTSHLLLHGNAYLLHVYNGAGSIVGLFPLHPSLVTPEWVCGPGGEILGKQYKMSNGDVKSDMDLTQIMGLSADGLQGYSPISLDRNAMGTAIAGDRAAARMFGSGMMAGGLVTSDETLTETDGAELMASLRSKMAGHRNASDLVLVNASLKFQPWTINPDEAQFLESRQYQVQEISRIFGVPVEMLSQNGASSWGTGLTELVKGWTKFCLAPWCARIEEQLSLLLPAPRHCEFSMAGLLQGSPADEIALLIQQVDAGILTVDEARGILNLAPLTKVEPVAGQDQAVLGGRLPGPGAADGPV